MEYVSYILVTLGILIACLLLMRPPAQPIQKTHSQARTSKTATKPVATVNGADTDTAWRSKLLLQRELGHVPIPWGWPGHQGYASSSRLSSLDTPQDHGVSQTISHVVDRLFTEKLTVDSQEYLLRKDASLRALVEDRYGRASTMKEIAYRRVKPPRLRDPSAPHDQMDNFPSGKVDQIAARIPRQPRSSELVRQQDAIKKTADLHMLRTPWGW